MIPFACLLACCIPAGDIGWQINQSSILTNVQVLYDFRLIRGQNGKVCGRTVNELLDRVLDPIGGYWEWVNCRTVLVLPEQPWCAPERGVDAPTPPCRKRVSI